MGHTRIGHLPNTHKWNHVVALIAGEASAAAVADATMDAANRGLEIAATDEGLRHTVWLLTRITLAAREPDFAGELQKLGISVPSAPSVFDIVSGFTEAVDERLSTPGSRTDIGEMAQMAAAETVTSICTEKARSLFETTPEDVRIAVASFATRAGFADLAHDFFSRLTNRFLSYHLSRELSRHVGAGGRFAVISEHQEFSKQLDTTCRQAATIIRDFAGGWHSKANYEGGITPQKARNFAWVALKKLRAELKLRSGRDV